jgi:DNA-binding NarL/FixJ family response regulator
MPSAQTPPPRAGVAIIEDQREIREGLRVLIDGTPGFRCTGAYESMEDALDALGRTQPDIAIVDIGLPGMSGIEGIAHLKQRHSALLVLMFTVYGDDRRIFDAICAGACGHVLKTTPPAQLLESLNEALSGGPASPGGCSICFASSARRSTRSTASRLTRHACSSCW